MGLLICKDCGTKILDKQYICPNCHSVNVIETFDNTKDKNFIVYYYDTNGCFKVLYKDNHFYVFDYVVTSQIADNKDIRKFTQGGATKCVNSLKKFHNDHNWDLKIMQI